MARHNQYATTCFYCRKFIQKNRGYLHRANNSWHAHCFECYDKRKMNKLNARKAQESDKRNAGKCPIIYDGD